MSAVGISSCTRIEALAGAGGDPGIFMEGVMPGLYSLRYSVLSNPNRCSCLKDSVC